MNSIITRRCLTWCVLRGLSTLIFDMLQQRLRSLRPSYCTMILHDVFHMHILHISIPRHNTLPLSEHVLDLAPVVAVNRRLQLVLVQPLKVLQPELVILEIGLPSHDARL